MEKQNKIDNLIDNAMQNLNAMVDVNTIIGSPIVTENGTIIPVSKVTMGYLTGGGEYGEVKYFKKDENYPFSGGSGAIVSMKPEGFLVYEGKGYRLIPMCSDTYDKLMNICENVINNLGDHE